MKKIGLLLLTLVLAGCGTQAVERLSVAELEELNAQFSTESFLDWGSIYEVFPIAFADGNGDDHGDIEGIIQALDYLNDGDESTTDDLGIGAIWFTPMYPSTSYHKYDVMDYKDIDPSIGTLDDFKRLVEECDKRGIKIIMDMVFNHSSSKHEWFTKAMAGDKTYMDYYRIETELDKEVYPKRSYWRQRDGKYYYAWFWEEMPEFNGESEAVREEFKSILDFWMDLGVDGFRFDAAKHMYNPDEFEEGTPTMAMNQQFWLELKYHVKQQNPDVLMLSEVWMSTATMAPYASGFDSMFNFDTGENIINTLTSGKNNEFVEKYMKGVEALEKRNETYVDSSFLTNHDQNRIRSLLRNDAQAKQAALLYLTLPGLPVIYYGEELGMLGMKPDEQIREPMKWQEGCDGLVACWEDVQYNNDTPSVEVQDADSESILNLYRSIVNYRSRSEVLKKGDIQPLVLENQALVGYTRTYQGETLTVIHNVSNQTITLELDGTLDFAHQASFEAGVITLQANGSIFLYE